MYNTKHNVRAYKSGLEEKVANQLKTLGITEDIYEKMTIEYIVPESTHKYTPDFSLPNGTIVETKGIFELEDRKKHLLIKQQHPELDIRFVFSNSRSKIYKGSKTTYAQWCSKNNFKYADKLIPKEWLMNG